MSDVSSWLLAITGVILLSVLCEMILPEGQMNRYIRVIFSFITIFVIIAPLPKLLGKNLDFSTLFPSSDLSLQEDYLYELNLNKLDAITKDLQSEIERQGIYNVSVSINANALSEELEIYGVYVELCDIEFSDNFENKNIENAKSTINEIISYMPSLREVPIEFSS